MSDYNTKFMKRYNQLMNEEGLSPIKAYEKAHTELGPDPNQPNLDGPILNAGIKIGASIVLGKFKTWVPLLGSAAWGAVFILKAIGKIPAASAIESFLTLIGVQPQFSPIDLTNIATGTGAVIKFYKMYKDAKAGVPKV